jgi:hypothetical protein
MGAAGTVIFAFGAFDRELISVMRKSGLDIGPG